MKRTSLFLPLLGLAPLGYFFASYLDGAGILPRGSGFLVSAFCMFVLPWAVSAGLAVRARTTRPFRILLFISTLVAQPILLLALVPPAATSEMRGIAHRLRREFPPDQLRDCADQLRHQFHAGTLAVGVRGKDDHFIVAADAVVVADADLPVSLRGRFQRVFIQKASAISDEQVVFALEEQRGIICDSRKDVHEFFICSMADGVHAYRYERL